MDGAKIQLSEEEKQLISNTEWILTKNSILARVNQLMIAVLDQQQLCLRQSTQLPPDALASTPKISRGENYQGLPYLVLDHPRVFLKEDTFAIRTFFWWGHFFSTTLQLSGSYKKTYEEKVIASYPELVARQIRIAISADPWEHHLEEDNYRAVHRFTPSDFAEHIRTHPFLKLTAVLPLSEWDSAINILGKDFRFLTGLLVT